MFNRFFHKSALVKTSILGRLAFATTCIEYYVKENNLKSIWIDRLINKLWEFTNSTDLGIWEYEIGDLNPHNILDSHPSNKATDYKSLSESDFEELKQLYNSLYPVFIEMISNTIEIGCANLYGGVINKLTLTPTMRVYDISKKLQKDVPNIKPFTMSKFNEAHGWGNPKAKEKFKSTT